MTDVPSNLIPTRITQLPEYEGDSTEGYAPYAVAGRTYKAKLANIVAPLADDVAIAADAAEAAKGAAQTYKFEAAASAESAAASAARAEAYGGPSYASQAAGEAATAAGEEFVVLSGGIVYVYERTVGGSTLLYTQPTGGALAATGTGQGSDLIGFHPDIAVTAPDWPGYAPGLEPNAAFSVLTRNTGEGGIGKAGVYSFMVNGTGNMVPFSTVGREDCVPVSAVVYSGEDAPHPVCATNIVSRYAGLPPGINWGLEIDMNNESATPYSTGDARGGQAVVLNTGSTYSPDTGIVVQRSPGEGTGPGWKQGMLVKGVRDAAFVAEAMSSATAPGMSPPATGTLAALVARVGGDAHNRFTITESGQMYWGSGSAFADVTISRSSANTLTVDGSFNASLVMGAQQYWVGANPVVGARKTGWGAPSGTATRTTFDTTTVTTAQLAERVKALIDDLTAHGLIGA